MANKTKLDKFADEVVRDMIKTLRRNVSDEKTRRRKAAKDTPARAPLIVGRDPLETSFELQA